MPVPDHTEEFRWKEVSVTFSVILSAYMLALLQKESAYYRDRMLRELKEDLYH